MPLRKVDPPTPEEYKRDLVRMALDFAPQHRACKACQWPVFKGYSCTTCGEIDP